MHGESKARLTMNSNWNGWTRYLRNILLRCLYHWIDLLLKLTITVERVSCIFQFKLGMASVSNGSGYGSEPTCFQISAPGRQYTQTVNSDPVQWTSHNMSELGGLSAGCPAGPSVNSYHAFVFAI